MQKVVERGRFEVCTDGKGIKRKRLVSAKRKRIKRIKRKRLVSATAKDRMFEVDLRFAQLQLEERETEEEKRNLECNRKDVMRTECVRTISNYLLCFHQLADSTHLKI